jgi:RimJ/RimL family protein N-acetyltransferase
MLIRRADAVAVGGVRVSRDGALAGETVEVPPHYRRPYARCAESATVCFVLEGVVRWIVDGVIYRSEASDAVVMPKGVVFNYEEWAGQPARLRVAHVPACGPEAEQLFPDLIREHDVHLRGERVSLRPMTEQDWPDILAWETDREVLYWFDGPDTSPRPAEETQRIYRGVSRFAYNFMIELDGEPIGICWLQKMNLRPIVERFPGRDLRRIDIAIGAKELWGQGLGSDAIRALVAFGFGPERADAVFGMVEPRNSRSWRAFEKAGFRAIELPDIEGGRALVVWREAGEQDETLKN